MRPAGSLTLTAKATAGPVCIGLIVTGCYASDASTSEPARTSPARFVLIIILGAVAVQWIQMQANRHPVDDDAGSRPDDQQGDGR